MDVVCPDCQHRNPPGALTCARCHRTLRSPRDTGALNLGVISDTLRLTTEAFDSEPLPTPCDVYEIILRIQNTPQPMVLELTPKGLILGRTDLDRRIFPDVDLSPFGAEQCGVSRRHARLSVNTSTKEVEVADLGSLNGTFVNGVRLTANQPRFLNSGDEMRLGRLSMVFFYRS